MVDTETEGCYSSPALADGTLYVGTDGVRQNHLLALGTDGKELWRFPTAKQIFSTPAVSGGLVYFHARDDHVYAVDARSGALVWKTPAPYPQDEFSIFADMNKSSPAVAGGRIFVGVGRDVLALDAKTGRELWRYATGGKVDSSPLVVGETVYVGSDDRGLYGLEASSGNLSWTYRTGGKVSGSFFAGGGLLLIGSNDGWLYAFGAASSP